MCVSIGNKLIVPLTPNQDVFLTGNEVVQSYVSENKKEEKSCRNPYFEKMNFVTGNPFLFILMSQRLFFYKFRQELSDPMQFRENVMYPFFQS